MHSGSKAVLGVSSLGGCAFAFLLKCMCRGNGMLANLANAVLLSTWQAWTGVTGIVALLGATHCIAAAAQTEAATLQ